MRPLPHWCGDAELAAWVGSMIDASDYLDDVEDHLRMLELPDFPMSALRGTAEGRAIHAAEDGDAGPLAELTAWRIERGQPLPTLPPARSSPGISAARSHRGAGVPRSRRSSSGQPTRCTTPPTRCR
jgi:hypothetical protein